MRTIEELRSPTSKSGFKHVGKGTGPKPFQAVTRHTRGLNGSRAVGPRRATGEESAQDYLDWESKQNPFTIEDIRNPQRKSGFDHVAITPGPNGKGNPYRAQVYGKATAQFSNGLTWTGPRRSTPEAAAQDYCDYVNTRTSNPRIALKTAGHDYSIDKSDRDPEVEAALGVLRDAKAQREGKQGYIYCIREIVPGGGLHHVKIGYSTNPKKRVAELQTGNPRPLGIVRLKKGTEADEKALHAKYIDRNVLQEWFTVTKEMLLEFDLDADGQPYTSDNKE